MNILFRFSSSYSCIWLFGNRTGLESLASQDVKNPVDGTSSEDIEVSSGKLKLPLLAL